VELTAYPPAIVQIAILVCTIAGGYAVVKQQLARVMQDLSQFVSKSNKDKNSFDDRLDAAAASAASYWNSTLPSSTLISLSTSGPNASGEAHVFSAFHSVEGFSKLGNYEGNGAADGTFVYCGFRPKMIICRSIDSTCEWYIYDSEREGYNVDNDSLFFTTGVELTANNIDLLSNGFKLRIATDPNVAETYIYAAWAEFPSGGGGVSQARAR